MSLKKITRRDALGLIAKSGATLGAGPAFFLSLKTSALGGGSANSSRPARGDANPQRPRAVGGIGEKVLIGGAGSSLVFKISGPPGRHCGVSYANDDTRERYKAAPGGRGVIGADGRCTIELDLKNIPGQRLYFRVVTGSSSDFVKDRRGTLAFEVTLANGTISRFGGVRERILDSATAAAGAAAACFQQTNR